MRFVRLLALAVIAMSPMFAGHGAVAEMADGVALSAVPFSRRLEGGTQQPIKIEIRRVAGTNEVVAVLDDVQPGRLTLDLSFLETDSYRLYVSSSGYATTSYYLDVKGGKAFRLPPVDNLFRKRSAIIRYTVNTAGKRAFEGPDVEQGRFDTGESNQIPRFLSDLRFGQRADQVVFDNGGGATGHGIARAPKGASFDQLTEAPTPDAYQWEQVTATEGLVLFIRNRGTKAEDQCYSKLIVESITGAPPTGERRKGSPTLPSPDASKTNTSSQTYRPKLNSSVAPLGQTVVSRSSAVPLRVTLEGNAMEPIGISIQRNAPGRPSVGKLKDVLPGNLTLDLSWLQPDAYFLFISATGYANAFAELVVKSQKVTLPTNNVTLFRKRYAIIRYNIAPDGKRAFDGPDLERGRSVVYHGRCLVPFLEGEWSGGQWSTNIFLHRQMAADFHGIAKVPTKTPFEQLVEAPPNDAYRYEDTQLTPGLILFFRTSKDERYGKLLVEDITETPPGDVHIIDSK